MSQTTTWTGNAADGVWETAGNWSNGVPISASSTIIVVINDTSGAGVNGPVASVTVGSANLQLPDDSANPIGYENLVITPGGSLTLYAGLSGNSVTTLANLAVLGYVQFGNDGNGGGITVTESLSVSQNGWSGDASAVVGAQLSNGASVSGSVGDYASFTSGANNQEGACGNFCTFDDGGGSGATQNFGSAGHGCQFLNGASNWGTCGDSALFDNGAFNAGSTGDYTNFTNGSYNGFWSQNQEDIGGQTGDHTTYAGASEDWGNDGDDVVFNDGSYAQNAYPSGDVTFNDTSGVAGASFAGNISWNSTGNYQSDQTPIYGGNTLTATTPLSIIATSYPLQPPQVLLMNLLDVTLSFSDEGGGLLTGYTIGASMTGDEIVASISSALVASGIPAASLMAQAKTDVQTALTAQGFTTARADGLDHLDVAVSSRGTFSGGAVVSVTGAVGSVTAPVTVGTLPNPAPEGYGAQAGAGSDQCTLTLTDGSTPIGNASVWISADSGGRDVVAGTSITDSNGQVKFLLTAGDTYYLWMERDGFNPILGQSFVAVKDA